MAARQRLRAVLDIRRASQPCWRCAMNLPRYNSSSPAGIPDTSMSSDVVPYENILARELEHTLRSFFAPKRLVDAKPAPARRSNGSESRSSETVQKPRIREMSDGRPVALSVQSQSPSMQAVQKPRIRVVSSSRPVVLAPRKVLSKSECKLDPRIRTHLGPPSLNHSSKLNPIIRTYLGRSSLEYTSTLEPLETNVAKKLPPVNDQGDSVTAEAKLPTTRRIWRMSDQTWEPRVVHVDNTPEEDISRPVERNSQKGKYFKVDIRRFKEFMAEKHGASVRLMKTTLIKKYLMGKGAPSIRYLLNHVNDVKVIHKVNHDFPRTEAPNILYVAEGDDATHLVHKAGPPLGKRPTDADELPSKGQHKDEDFDNALTSLLDEFKDHHISKFDNPSIEVEDPIPSTRFSPQDHLIRSAALSGSRTSNLQKLDLSRRSFSTRTPGALIRFYATAASQTLQADDQVDPPIIGTNQDGHNEGKSGGIRETLRLWQEQHDNALADSSGPTPSSSLNDTQNLFTQSREDDSFTAVARDDYVEDDGDLEFGSDEPTPDIFAPQVFLRRGDLVELRAASEPILAIFVRNMTDQCQFYTIRGEWVHRQPGSVLWAVSRFVDPDDLNEILPYLPAQEVAEEKLDRLQPVDVNAPRDAGGKVIKQMSLFHQTADAVYRTHADRIDRLYEIIAPSEAFADRKYMSLKDIAMKVLMKEDPSQLTQPMMWAIHRAISQCQNIMWDRLNYRQNPVYEIFSQQGLKHISQVREWVRGYQEGVVQDMTSESLSSIDSTLVGGMCSPNPIAAFVKKARVAIQQSRQTRPLSESGFVGPSSIRIDMDENFGMPYRELHMQRYDDNEKTIIHYLDVWATSSYVNIHTNLASLGPMILRAIGMYEGFELDESRGFTLLQELGVVKPWENRTVYRLRNLRLPGHDGGSGEASRLLLNARKETKVFEPKDSMEGLRKDWGDMPVFCIDSAETLERDDGVSLEVVDNDPSACWVHVHVANPSAFITPDSATAKYAALLAESVYFPERKYPMLSPILTKDRLSLANDRPCITFSAKISADGDILEKNITPGIVRNVHYLTPRMVGQGLGLTKTDEESETVSILTVGGRMPTQPIDDSDQTAKALTDPEHVKILQKLLELGEAARHKRAQSTALDFHASARIAATYPVVYLSRNVITYFKINDKHIKQFEGDPIITLQRTTEAFGLVATMVSDLMIIAGDVGASWCSERNMPIPYRGILRNPEPASPPEVFKREVLDPKIAKNGHAEQSDLLRYMRLVGQSQTSDRPLEHHTLGLPAYCKATSPLRRHIDMYTHWQIEAALRHEAATGTSLVGSTDESYLPFSRAQVEEYAGGAIHREKKIALAKISSTRHWICQALFRAFYFKEATLPETFEVMVVEGKARRGLYAGWVKVWNVKVQLTHGAAVVREGGWRVGDVWEARLSAVDTYHENIDMEPIRLIERERVSA